MTTTAPKMNKAEKIEAKAALFAKITAALPTIKALADTSGRLVRITVGDLDPSINISIAMPGTNEMTISGEMKWGATVWEVEASGWSWKNTTADELLGASRVLATAAAIVAVLKTLG